MNSMILKNGEYAVGDFIPDGATLIPKMKPDGPYSWNGSDWVFDGYSKNEAFCILRRTRNHLLSTTDWWVLSDVNPTQEQLDYRQSLRDLPANSPNAELDENGNLINVNWPTPPTE